LKALQNKAPSIFALQKVLGALLVNELWSFIEVSNKRFKLIFLVFMFFILKRQYSYQYLIQSIDNE